MKSHLVEMLNKAIIIIIIIIIVIIICCCSLLIIAIKLRLFTTLRNMQFTQDGATERNKQCIIYHKQCIFRACSLQNEVGELASLNSFSQAFKRSS